MLVRRRREAWALLSTRTVEGESGELVGIFPDALTLRVPISHVNGPSRGIVGEESSGGIIPFWSPSLIFFHCTPVKLAPNRVIIPVSFLEKCLHIFWLDIFMRKKLESLLFPVFSFFVGVS